MGDGRFVVRVPKKKRPRVKRPSQRTPTHADALDPMEVKLIDELMGDLEQVEGEINPAPDPHMNDPESWIRDKLGETIWSKQKEICRSVVGNRFTAVKSCHQIGKSYIASRIAAWWVDTHPDAFVVTTAPSGHQVKTILWREIRRAHKKGHLKGKITEGQVPEWKINQEVVGFGRKPADYVDSSDAATRFQGIHALHVLIIIDEASGIPQWLWDAVETLVGNERSRVLCIGNPDNPASVFAKQFRPTSDYQQITVSAWDTPAYTGEQVPEDLLDLLVSKMWVEERRRRWGEKSPLWQSKVMGEFPALTDNTVFSPATIAIGIAIDRSSYAVRAGAGNVGWDVAAMGADENVLYANRSGFVRIIDQWGKTDTVDSVGRIKRRWEGKPRPNIVIDVIGIGTGPYDTLRHLGWPINPFNGGERAFNPMRFRNRRAEAYWEAKEMMEQGLVDIEESDEDLQAELLEVQFKTTSTGQVQLEDKDDIRSRLGRSPNRADAFVMSLQKSMSWATSFPTPTEHAESQEEFRDAEDLVADLLDVQLCEDGTRHHEGLYKHTSAGSLYRENEVREGTPSDSFPTRMQGAKQWPARWFESAKQRWTLAPSVSVA